MRGKLKCRHLNQGPDLMPGPLSLPKIAFRQQQGGTFGGKDQRVAILAAGERTSTHVHEDLPTPAVCATVMSFESKTNLSLYN